MYFQKFIFEPSALKTEYGRAIFNSLSSKGLNPQIGKIKARTECGYEQFREGKRTLIIGSRNLSRFETCKPSANYQLPILTGCPGMCEYCYLITRMGEKPYVKININIDNILTIIQNYINNNPNSITSFELSASSDPLPFEEPTGIVSKMIENFADMPNGKLRICTKFEPETSILNARHNGHTDFRFSLNTENAIKEFEHATPSLERRIIAAQKTIDADYNVGIMLAPVFLNDSWQNDYKLLLDKIKDKLGDNIRTFEVVTHRYTSRAKGVITNIFPETKLDMEDSKRKFKMGQFGYGKYVYEKDKINEAREFFKSEIERRFKSAELLYVV